MSLSEPFPLPPSLEIDKTLYVAYSGGKDSSVLLHKLSSQLVSTELTVKAIYINHHLHPNSTQWEEHCSTFCDKYKISFQAVSVEVSRETRKGLEKKAREARLNAFSSLLPKRAVLVIAHHQQDQAETMLLQLFRGGGINALSGMKPFYAYKHFYFWRPMLLIDKHSIDDYAQKHQLSWIDDPSNTDTAIRRNHLRINVLPQIEKQWENLSQRLANSNRWAQRELFALEFFFNNELSKLFLSPPPFALQSISKEPLLSYPSDVVFLFIKHWLQKHEVRLLESYLSEIVRQLLSNINAEFEIKSESQSFVLCFQNRALSLYRDDYAQADCKKDWRLFSYVQKNGEEINLKRINGNSLNIRECVGGEKVIENNQPMRLKQWYKINKIPRCWRRRPLLYSGESIVGVLGLTFF